jgi:hypothetical protein
MPSFTFETTLPDASRISRSALAICQQRDSVGRANSLPIATVE